MQAIRAEQQALTGRVGFFTPCIPVNNVVKCSKPPG